MEGGGGRGGEEQQQQQGVGSRQQTGGGVAHVAVAAVAAVNFDPRSSVALAVGLAAEGLVGAGLHHPA